MGDIPSQMLVPKGTRDLGCVGFVPNQSVWECPVHPPVSSPCLQSHEAATGVGFSASVARALRVAVETGVTLPPGDPAAIITVAEDVRDKPLNAQGTDNIKKCHLECPPSPSPLPRLRLLPIWPLTGFSALGGGVWGEEWTVNGKHARPPPEELETENGDSAAGERAGRAGCSPLLSGLTGVRKDQRASSWRLQMKL